MSQFTQESLSYSFDALEPHIDAKTMEIHFGKHHAGYVAKLNAAIEGHTVPAQVEDLIKSIKSLPENIQNPVRNNGGGHANHALFWESLSPNGGGTPSGGVADAITAKWGNFESFQTEFETAAATRFGSGWAWLCVSAEKGVSVCSTANQDNPLMDVVDSCNCTPILGLDVWEHAYYLNYQNRRPDYIKAFWNIVDWSVVNARFESAS